jgi:hypothetical protein
VTMPSERTRALHFGWEFLRELRDTADTKEEIRSQVTAILQHYPSSKEIRAKVEIEAKRPAGTRFMNQQLEPEDPRPDSQNDDEDTGRLPVSPVERSRALKSAYSLFMDLRMRDNLSSHIKRQISYVLRHFPDSRDFDHWARTDAWEASQDPAFVAWLAPEVTTLEEKLAAFEPAVHGGEVMPFLSEFADDEAISKGSNRHGDMGKT